MGAERLSATVGGARTLAVVGSLAAAPYPWRRAMAHRSSRRWLAPTALAVAAAALTQTVTSGGKTGGSARPATPAADATARSAPARTYRVKPGDVLSTIAESTGVPLARIERLNPDVDAKALHAGQQITLAP